MTDAEVFTVAKVLDCLAAKREPFTADFLFRTNHLPLKAPGVFDNFDSSRITGRNTESLRILPVLSSIYSYKDPILVGRPGTGKTHLAQTFGRICYKHGFKAYFIKMTELRDCMISIQRAGRERRLLSSLVCPSCLIIDEVGHCEFDKRTTFINC